MNRWLMITVMVLIPGLILPGCRKNDQAVRDPPEGWINLSELKSMTDYYLPFAIRNDTGILFKVLLNGVEEEFPQGGFLEFPETGFYELILEYREAGRPADTLLFTTKTPDREDSEWGIRAWTPDPFDKTLLTAGDPEVIYPRRYTGAIDLPFIFYIREAGQVYPVYCAGKGPASGDTFNIKRGVGSLNIPGSETGGQVQFSIGGKKVTASVTKVTEITATLAGIINTPVTIPANAVVNITGNLEITAPGSLTVNEGALILVDEAVDINTNGPVLFKGTQTNPILVTCSEKEKYWGGFITRSLAGSIDADYTIFCRSGYHDSEGYNWGHSGRQALFYSENSTLNLNRCFITDHIGQVFYPNYSTLVLTNILVQRVQTGGQVNYSRLTIDNSVFTDFPDDSNEFIDGDNDGLYLSASDAEISNTVFMYAKDDGLDSGNEEGGEINIINCRFEACFHEGAALSSGGNAVKNHAFTGCTFINCGQGLELGFSSPGHSVTAENCQFLHNGVGIRYGDNYTWANVEGKMQIRNSFSKYNDRDVWNMVRKTWKPKLPNLTFINTRVSKFCSQYPGLPVEN